MEITQRTKHVHAATQEWLNIKSFICLKLAETWIIEPQQAESSVVARTRIVALAPNPARKSAQQIKR